EGGGVGGAVARGAGERVADERGADESALTDDAEREAGARRLDDVHLPAAEELVHGPAAVEVAPALAERQVNDRAQREEVAYVEDGVAPVEVEVEGVRRPLPPLVLAVAESVE